MDKDEKYSLSKLWYQSRTIIFNVFVAVVSGLASIIHESAVVDFFKDNYSVVLIGITIANVYLRLITTKPITFEKSE